ncbi:CRISPR system Cascade subunit CasA [Trueperella bonasi]|uniref:CRISPR system Cascade subunit CasA n=1 Tax=Trueperella bonasi TaxID=312286 RepID=A0ABT9NET2_9ACTO|nr:type I-E CRISPR-associated protein Cse1/CasA [Trueperella bonasi]MDP9805892.1 CRISPR system Cascade subunit CasA [Trueperella bonasi]
MFSLLDDPWIKAIDCNGGPVSTSIRGVFDGSHELALIQGDSPAQNYAVIRLLLAIFWRAHQKDTRVGPGEVFEYGEWFEDLRESLMQTGRDDAVLTYLFDYEDRFKLTDVSHPFMQVADLHVASGEIKHVSTIVPESQDDYFTMRAGKDRDSLSLDEAARWLIYVQAFDYSGIKSGAVGDSRVKGGKGYPIGTGWSGMTGGTLVLGENLLDTLILNSPSSAITNPDDHPVWERTPDGPDARLTVGENPYPQGAADLATWQARRVRLHVEGDRVTGVVVCNGDRIPDAGANVFGDPMTPYRYSTNKSKKGRDVYYPRPYDVDRTLWKALDALVVSETDGGFSDKEKAPKRPRNLNALSELRREIDGIPDILNLELVSVEYGPQASSVSTTYSSQVSMPVIVLMEQAGYLRQKIREAAGATMKAAVSLGQFAGNLRLAAGGDYEFDSSRTDRVLADLEPRFNSWLRDLSQLSHEEATIVNEEVENLAKEWQVQVRAVIDAQAQIELRGAGPRAFVGRVLDQSEESSGRMVSAASYYQFLQWALDKNLPKTTNSSSKGTSENKERMS